MNAFNPNLKRSLRLLIGIALVLLLGCQHLGWSTQQSFATPEAATEALLDGIERDDRDALLALLGRQHEDALITSDWDANRETRQTIAREARARHELVEIDADTRELIVGSEEWPFPMPIVREGTSWRFDTDAGIQELIDRRVGRNELVAITIMHAYVDAQIEYASQDRDDDEMLEYAQKIASTPGKRDGLYWESTTDDDVSPIGPLLVRAERYLSTHTPGDPLRGYYFKILSSQGPNAGSGARDYTIGDNMLTGFALVGYPADYGSSGIMTFVVSHRGHVYQKNLGDFAGMEAYDPDETWTRVEE